MRRLSLQPDAGVQRHLIGRCGSDPARLSLIISPHILRVSANKPTTMKSEAAVQRARRIWWLPWMQEQEAVDIWLNLLEKADAFLPHPDEEAAICASCSGICCDAISYIVPGGRRGEYNRGRQDMEFTHMEMLALGADFRWDLDITGHTPCLHHDPRIGCRQWADRPALCRSYHCHGEHWIPKEV